MSLFLFSGQSWERSGGLGTMTARHLRGMMMGLGLDWDTPNGSFWLGIQPFSLPGAQEIEAEGVTSKYN